MTIEGHRVGRGEVHFGNDGRLESYTAVEPTRNQHGDVVEPGGRVTLPE